MHGTENLNIIFPFLHSPSVAVIDTVLPSVPLNVMAYGTRAIWRLSIKPLQTAIFLQVQSNLTTLTQGNKLT
jgi:hypothetical protein